MTLGRSRALPESLCLPSRAAGTVPASAAAGFDRAALATGVSDLLALLLGAPVQPDPAGVQAMATLLDAEGSFTAEAMRDVAGTRLRPAVLVRRTRRMSARSVELARDERSAGLSKPTRRIRSSGCRHYDRSSGRRPRSTAGKIPSLTKVPRGCGNSPGAWHTEVSPHARSGYSTPVRVAGRGHRSQRPDRSLWIRHSRQRLAWTFAH